MLRKLLAVIDRSSGCVEMVPTLLTVVVFDSAGANRYSGAGVELG